MLIYDLYEEVIKAKNGDANSNVNLTGRHHLVRPTWHSMDVYRSSVLTEPEHKSHKLNIGDFVSIANECRFFLGGNHNHKRVTTFLPGFGKSYPKEGNILTKGSINIGADVWIGQGATVLSGITIGVGAIVGAGAVVTKDVEPYTIVGGNPCKVIGKRFDDETIEALLKTKWWEKDLDFLKEREDLLFSEDIQGFINSFETK